MHRDPALHIVLGPSEWIQRNLSSCTSDFSHFKTRSYYKIHSTHVYKQLKTRMTIFEKMDIANMTNGPTNSQLTLIFAEICQEQISSRSARLTVNDFNLISV